VPTLYSINFGAKAPTSFAPEAAVNGILKILNPFHGHVYVRLPLHLEPLTLYFVITMPILFVKKFLFEKDVPVSLWDIGLHPKLKN